MTRPTILAVFVVTACRSNAAFPAAVAANNLDANGGLGVPIFYLQAGVLAPVGQNIFVQILGGAVGSPMEPLAEPADGILTIAIGTGGAGPGFFDAGPALVPGVVAGSQAQFQVLVWQGTSGFANARYAVASPVWTQATGAWDNILGISGPGLQIPVASLTIVPESSTLTLALLGGVVWLLQRRGRCVPN